MLLILLADKIVEVISLTLCQTLVYAKSIELVAYGTPLLHLYVLIINKTPQSFEEYTIVFYNDLYMSINIHF